MQKFLVLCLASMLVVSCGRNEAKLAQARAGTWVAELSTGRSTVILKPDGSYSCQLDGTNGKVTHIEGTVRFTRHYLIETETRNSDPVATNMPYVSKAVIVHMDDNEYTIEPEYSIDKRVTFKKLKN